MKVVYEPHPVSPERKAELRTMGCKIIDIRFMPESMKSSPEGPTEARKPRRQRTKRTKSQ